VQQSGYWVANGDLREDFELFFEREEWFRRHAFPFRRGYLFYGPPGNGKTTAIRIMACHPAVAAYTFDFYDERADNDAMNSLFEAARRAAPSLVIFEDLDRVFGTQLDNDRPTRVTL
jgi:chaperone BCS1